MNSKIKSIPQFRNIVVVLCFCIRVYLTLNAREKLSLCQTFNTYTLLNDKSKHAPQHFAEYLLKADKIAMEEENEELVLTQPVIQ